MKVKLGVLAAALAATIGLAAVAATFAPSAQAAPPAVSATAPISLGQSGGILDGTFSITNFTTNAQNQLVANGVFTGLVNGQQVSTPASAILNAPARSCRILDLTLGPLHLDLLGLVVDLNQVHLTITAVPGPGNLLGNLLCTIAGLLDNNANPNAIQNLLNHINAILARL